MRHTLALVMPVYNEEECIVDVLRSWVREFERLGIEFQAFVLDDGSRDGTADRLTEFAADARLNCVSKSNEGHGPTILRGYHEAVEAADWVFQCDSDDEMKPEHFERVWTLREECDAVFGYRVDRAQDPARSFITLVSRAVIGTLFGRRVRDVNTPFRLMRSEALSGILRSIPADTFAPNLLIAGGFSRGPWRIAECPVPHQPRQTGQVSLVKFGVLKAATRAFVQTLRYRFGAEGRNSGVTASGSAGEHTEARRRGPNT